MTFVNKNKTHGTATKEIHICLAGLKGFPLNRPLGHLMTPTPLTSLVILTDISKQNKQVHCKCCHHQWLHLTKCIHFFTHAWNQSRQPLFHKSPQLGSPLIATTLLQVMDLLLKQMALTDGLFMQQMKIKRDWFIAKADALVIPWHPTELKLLVCAPSCCSWMNTLCLTMKTWMNRAWL